MPIAIVHYLRLVPLPISIAYCHHPSSTPCHLWQLSIPHDNYVGSSVRLVLLCQAFHSFGIDSKFEFKTAEDAPMSKFFGSRTSSFRRANRSAAASRRVQWLLQMRRLGPVKSLHQCQPNSHRMRLQHCTTSRRSRAASPASPSSRNEQGRRKKQLQGQPSFARC